MQVGVGVQHTRRLAQAGQRRDVPLEALDGPQRGHLAARGQEHSELAVDEALVQRLGPDLQLERREPVAALEVEECL
jgi:hypothetical protein